MTRPPDDRNQPPSHSEPGSGRTQRSAWLARLRDQTDLKGGLVSVAIGTMTMELVGQAFGPLPPVVTGLGALAIALVALFGVVPVLRRGRWRR